MFLGKNPLSPYLGNLPSLFANKYVLVFVLFVVWISFFDKHSLITNYQLTKEHNSLLKENKDYQDQIAETQNEIHKWDQDLEKFAREKYYFQKENEDVFVVVKN